MLEDCVLLFFNSTGNSSTKSYATKIFCTISKSKETKSKSKLFWNSWIMELKRHCSKSKNVKETLDRIASRSPLDILPQIKTHKRHFCNEKKLFRFKFPTLSWLRPCKAQLVARILQNRFTYREIEKEGQEIYNSWSTWFSLGLLGPPKSRSDSSITGIAAFSLKDKLHSPSTK